ncbi:acylphosphatase [Alteribacter aurantiacus]|uniref:acylphosphatase n=1 Tax=Alteribacter aurantiacus TaxID=254410 RepID=UPI0003FD40F4|nr:acylphosphatase [Alteribacter aurantiacus]
MKRIHGIVSGKVQGVGFRYFTMQEAIEHNLKGWVRNRSDGTVEFEAEGKEASLKSFTAKVKKGSRTSKVDNVVTYEIEPKKTETRFRKRKTK